MISLQIIPFLLYYAVATVYSLECRYCNSEDYNSDCRFGTEEKTRVCTIEGEDHCYEEYLIGNEKRNGDYVPLYRRGCAPSDWCTRQQNLHRGALKFCKVCQGDKCNNDRFGAANSSSLECHACWSVRGEAACRYGYKCDFSLVCPPGSTKCYEEYIVNGNFPQGYKPRWKRGCATDDYCSKEKEKHGSALIECRQCKRDLCNTGELDNNW
ncbi:uncharacterized protein LOC123307252 [Coccinella septempunctata]|uniref:uncharacterized protein LOC123307252 n=1 Tax=Coccinella septempunctata TaxID=41139 RepID=UPI001D08CB92|nr:uncharacterized protein LOC123307252 [Coccinella septempunctata]